MAKSSSKRKRRQQEKFSLKHKGRSAVDSAVDVNDLLSDELRNEAVNQQVILPRKKQKPGGGDSKPVQPAASGPSKSEQRKLKQIDRQKHAQAKVKDAIAALNASKLDDAALSILVKTSTRGGTVTASQRLRRDMVLHQAGVQLPADSQLLRMSTNPASHFQRSAEVPVGESSDSGSSDVVWPHHSTGKDGIERSPISQLPKRDLSQRVPPTIVAFGRKPGGTHEHGTGSSIKSGKGDFSPASALPSIDPNLVRDAEELRCQMIASEEIQVAETAEPQPGQGRSVPSLGPTRHRPITRSAELEEARLQLPVLGMEQEVMAMVDEHDVFLLCGATGCGKTTQPRRVAAISTARRVAEEMGQSGFSASGDGLVGYQVRHDKSVGAHAALKFMTDGILMREVQEDFLLTRYSVIIIDEAHERSLNTDLLIGMISRIVPQRRAMNAAGKVHPVPGATGEARAIQPLKLIIMSATLRVDDFLKNERLFPSQLYPSGPPPLINVPARQFPVTVHFSKRTEMADYVGAAYRKVSRIHRELPPGGVLVFVTGQREVQHLCKRLQANFPSVLLTTPVAQDESAPAAVPQGTTEEETTVFEVDGADRAEAEADMLQGSLRQATDDDTLVDSHDDFVDSDLDEDEDETVQLGDSGMSPEDIAAAEEYFERRYGSKAPDGGPNGGNVDETAGSDDDLQHDAIGVRAPCGPGPSRHAAVHVLPLYAMLLQQEQRRVFEDPPDGHRLIVVATNVAETSLTIPGIRYVVDAGRAKAKLYEELSGVNRYEVRWISQASADQRAGRAGRTGPGHCYRLFSSAVFNDTFPNFSPPEITNMPLEGVVLSMHALGLPKIINFPFPSPPSMNALRGAEQSLLSISALQVKSAMKAARTATGSDLELTPMGIAMAAFPISPRHSRMILAAVDVASTRTKNSAETVHHALGLAAALSSESPFLEADTVVMADQHPTGHGASEKNESISIRNRVYSAHQRLRDPQSDALSALNVLLAFEAEPNSGADAFCKRNFLHATHLREMSALRAQLVRIVAMQSRRHQSWAVLKEMMESLDNAPEAARSLMKPLSQGARKTLSCCIAAGWADQVAKRVRSRAQLDNTAAQGKASRAIRYQSCSHDSELFIHPRSFLHKRAPDLVVYLGQTSTEKRTYMHTMTCVDPEWLVKTGEAMCDISDPASEVAPAYDAAMDEVLCWCHASYGMHSWPLPMYAVTHPDPTERCAHFAAALLAGRVIKAMRQLQPILSVKPAQVTTTAGRSLRKVSDLLTVLQGNSIDCRHKLFLQWQKDGVLTDYFMRHCVTHQPGAVDNGMFDM